MNAYTTDTQVNPSICCDPRGNFVVAWSSFQDGSETGVFARTFTATGGAGDEFQVNTYTTNFQENPELACSAAGNFVVVWESFTQDGSDDGVFGQRFAASIAAAPALTFAGIAATVVGLLVGGTRALRRRRKD